jgi:hypothetical protein
VQRFGVPAMSTARHVSAPLKNPGAIVAHLSLEKQKPFTCNTNRAGAYYKLLGFCFSLQLITVLFFDVKLL